MTVFNGKELEMASKYVLRRKHMDDVKLTFRPESGLLEEHRDYNTNWIG